MVIYSESTGVKPAAPGILFLKETICQKTRKAMLTKLTWAFIALFGISTSQLNGSEARIIDSEPQVAQTSNFFADRPYLCATAISGAAVGAYYVASKCFDLPSISSLGTSAGQIFKSQIALAKKITSYNIEKIFRPVEFEMISALKPKPKQILKKLAGPVILGSLITAGIAGINAHSPSFIDFVLGDTFIMDYLPGDRTRPARSPTEISAAEHLTHAFKIYLITFFLFDICTLPTLSSTTSFKSPISTFDMELRRCITTPIIEETIYTYIPWALFGKYAQYIMPTRFGAAHTQYDLTTKIRLGLLNFIGHKSLQTGYIYTPIIMHIFNNLMASALERVQFG